MPAKSATKPEEDGRGPRLVFEIEDVSSYIALCQWAAASRARNV